MERDSETQVRDHTKCRHYRKELLSNDITGGYSIGVHKCDAGKKISSPYITCMHCDDFMEKVPK